MKQIVFLSIAILLFASCSKDDNNGPSMTDNLSRQWEVVKYEVNGFDETATFESLFPEYSIDFNTDGTYTEYYLVFGTQVPVNGTWTFLNNNVNIQLVDPNQTRLYQIVELSSAKLTVEDANTPEDDVYYLEPK